MGLLPVLLVKFYEFVEFAFDLNSVLFDWLYCEGWHYFKDYSTVELRYD